MGVILAATFFTIIKILVEKLFQRGSLFQDVDLMEEITENRCEEGVQIYSVKNSRQL